MTEGRQLHRAEEKYSQVKIIETSREVKGDLIKHQGEISKNKLKKSLSHTEVLFPDHEVC